MTYTKEFPCKVGDEVYYIKMYNCKPLGGISRGHIQMLGYTNRSVRVLIREYHPHNTTFVLGEKAFLDIRDAEKALEELKR